MKKIWIAVVTAGIFSVASLAQTSAQANSSANTSDGVQTGAANANASSNTSLGSGVRVDANHPSENHSASSTGTLAAGTTIPATLNKSIDSRKAKAGDEVTAKTTREVRSNSGMVIPKGSRLVGHITDAKAKAKGDSESSLGIAFDHAVLRNGQQVPFNASIRALAASANNASAAMNDDTMGASGNSSLGADTSGSMSAPRAGGMLGGAANTVGGVANTAGNTVGGAASGVGNTAANVGTEAGSTVNGTTRGAAGQLTSQSQGVIGMNGLSLNSAAANNTSGSVITSTGKNVKLDSGAQLLLQVNQQ